MIEILIGPAGSEPAVAVVNLRHLMPGCLHLGSYEVTATAIGGMYHVHGHSLVLVRGYDHRTKISDTSEDKIFGGVAAYSRYSSSERVAIELPHCS